MSVGFCSKIRIARSCYGFQCICSRSLKSGSSEWILWMASYWHVRRAWNEVTEISLGDAECVHLRRVSFYW